MTGQPGDIARHDAHIPDGPAPRHPDDPSGGAIVWLFIGLVFLAVFVLMLLFLLGVVPHSPTVIISIAVAAVIVVASGGLLWLGGHELRPPDRTVHPMALGRTSIADRAPASGDGDPNFASIEQLLDRTTDTAARED
jgi:hypothetical protein